METRLKSLKLIASAVLIATVMTFLVMWLWNWIMPKIFGLVVINYWEALGLMILCNCLFKTKFSTK